MAWFSNSIKLKDINLTFDKNEKINSLILKLSLSKIKEE